MTDYFREFSDVYFQALAIMKERTDSGLPNNEGLLFIKTEDAAIDPLHLWYLFLFVLFLIAVFTFIGFKLMR